MQVKVVYHTAQGQQTVEVSGVDECCYDSDLGVLSLNDDDGNALAEFNDWTYWQKTAD